ncbi:MAG: BrnT family toxin [Acidobacteriota bacterium]
MEFEWDIVKAKKNMLKHGIDFADATGVFDDPMALTFEDQIAYGEVREITLGMDTLDRLLVVVYTYHGETIRIISARKATKRERGFYEGHG